MLIGTRLSRPVTTPATLNALAGNTAALATAVDLAGNTTAEPAGLAAEPAGLDLIGEALLDDPVESLPDILSQVVEPVLRVFGHLLRRFRHAFRQIGVRFEIVCN
ncbi:hypothetical protein [Micromonospora qiuiae]|uniref:hypothetical protein n=1 Tax=Micromonospora qiuiae TaxID=502268 RepID=UPI001950C99F|nr:hypothetical protein [Micromonospora qiuiae]